MPRRAPESPGCPRAEAAEKTRRARREGDGAPRRRALVAGLEPDWTIYRSSLAGSGATADKTAFPIRAGPPEVPHEADYRNWRRHGGCPFANRRKLDVRLYARPITWHAFRLRARGEAQDWIRSPSRSSSS